jgi:hypothetical protein
MKVIQCTVYALGIASAAAGVKVNPKIPEAVVNPLFVPRENGKKLGLCESDCDVDSDCLPGLWCTDKHETELKKMGLDDNVANCYNVKTRSDWEVCFDPKILSSGGAGGGTFDFDSTTRFSSK